jgi:hypothetical protein
MKLAAGVEIEKNLKVDLAFKVKLEHRKNDFLVLYSIDETEGRKT